MSKLSNDSQVIGMDLYRFYRPQIWTGDLIEFRSRTLLGAAIRWVTKKPVNHTSQVMRYTNFDTHRVYILEALAKGVYPNFLSRRIKDFKGEIYWLPLKSEYDPLRAAVAREAHKYIGIGYDYRSLLKQAVSRVSSEASRFFCSEYCYQTAVDAGLPVEAEHAPWPGEFGAFDIYHAAVRIF